MTAVGDLDDPLDLELEMDEAQEGRRIPSAIQFPYGDLNDAVEVAHAMYANAGSSGGSWEQLAGWLGYNSASSGAFRNKVATARIFGLTETKSGGAMLTQLGQQAADPARERAARSTAFLNVPLFRAIYENHRGITLPPDGGLEQEMMALGVSPRQKERARQIFQRSADQAGFFAYGRNKLVMPVAEILDSRASGQDGASQFPRTSVAEDPEPLPRTHPLIAGLFLELPPPGAAWPREKRQHWLATAEHILTLVYREE